MKSITGKQRLATSIMILFAAHFTVAGTIITSPVLASPAGRQAVPIHISNDREIVAAHCRIGDGVARAVRLAKIEFVPSLWMSAWLREWELCPGWTEKDVYCHIGNPLTQAASNFDVAKIDVGSILLNGSVPVSQGSEQILPTYPGFGGQVLRVGFDKREALLTLDLEALGSSSGSEEYRVTVRGRIPEEAHWFYGFAFIQVTGEELAKTPSATPDVQQETPDAFELFQNHPNPFNPETEISYDLPNDAHVTLTVFNIVGQKVKTLVDASQTAGHKSLRWDGKDDSGNRVSSGVYFYRIQAGECSQTRRMVLVK
jgi:hypothetical protein